MCTKGGLGRHIDRYIDRQSTNASPDMYTFIGRQSTDYRSIVDRSISRYVHIYRSTVGRYIGPLSADLSVDYRPTIGQLFDSRPIYRPMYRPICRPRPPIVHMIHDFFGSGSVAPFLFLAV